MCVCDWGIKQTLAALQIYNVNKLLLIELHLKGVHVSEY